MIEGQIKPDLQHAFKIPAGFVRQTARRSRGWNGYCYVDSRRDLALQMLASVSTTIADRYRADSIRSHILAKTMPWQCPGGQVDELCRILSRFELVFTEVESLTHDGGQVVGFISDPFFSPQVGIIPLANGWEELDGGIEGIVAGMLVNQALPGARGPSSVQDSLLRRFEESVAVPDKWFVSESDCFPGRPLDHSSRHLIVERFRMGNEMIDRERAESAVRLGREELVDALGHDCELTLSEEDFGFAVPVWMVRLSWRPRLYESSVEAFEKVCEPVSRVFDRILPHVPLSSAKLYRTLEVLKYLGSFISTTVGRTITAGRAGRVFGSVESLVPDLYL